MHALLFCQDHRVCELRKHFSFLFTPFFEDFSAARPISRQQVNNQLVHNFLSQLNTRLFLSSGGDMYTFWGGPPEGPPPLTPLLAPPPKQKGYRYSAPFQIGIHLHTHQDLKLKCCRFMGQKLRYGRPCTRDLHTRHP